jgi:hypothetical protein
MEWNAIPPAPVAANTEAPHADDGRVSLEQRRAVAYSMFVVIVGGLSRCRYGSMPHAIRRCPSIAFHPRNRALRRAALVGRDGFP